MRLESLDSRALAAVRFLDGETEQPLTPPLAVSGDGVRVVRNRWGLYVITEAPGLEDYTARFEAPPEPGPAPRSFTLSVVDPSGRHLPRSFSLELPLGVEDAVFEPVDVRMYLAPTARPSPGSAVVRLSLTNEQNAPLAARRVLRLRVDLLDKPAIKGLGLSDERGEALLLVPRIPIIRWGHEQGESLSHRIFSATLESALAPSVAGLPDPDVPDQSFTPLPLTLQVASGLETNRRIPIPTS
ncbi:hypothetical protein [Archangium lipolyticum]|uniref:hypothetical protein n=1 Tax=Archangium lipolyticum TaxID=2970465 RepID=UPI00214A579B|nr:hypothetical protein [Archangium lipolyticum]